MEIVVIGGTRLVGSKLVEKLSLAGHNALMASPATGVDTLTGEDLAFVLARRHRAGRRSGERP
jgi:uncharacterized protein YbjT (DUF2867 family)